MLDSVEVLIYLGLIGLLVLWLLLPLVPAVLLYRLFPNATITATGVLANFKINATGAFAGYLVLFAAMIPLVNTTHDFVGTFMRPYWIIKGHIKIVDKDGRELHHPELFRKIIVRTQPELHSFQDPLFVMSVPENSDGGLPLITFEIPNFGTPQILTAGSRNLPRDKFRKKIELNAPLVIREMPRNVSYDTHPQ